MNTAEETGIQWARVECEFARLDDEGLAAIATPLAGEWCVEDCGEGVLALTLAALPPPADDADDPGDAGDAAMSGEDADTVAEDEPQPGESETGCVLRFVEQRFANLVASASVRLGDGVAGLVYRASKKGDYLCMELDPQAAEVALVRVKAGHREVLATAPADLPRGEWLHLYLRHVNPFHNLSINGSLVLTAEYRVPGGYLATGAVGVKGVLPRDARFARLGAVDVVAGD